MQGLQNWPGILEASSETKTGEQECAELATPPRIKTRSKRGGLSIKKKKVGGCSEWSVSFSEWG